MSGQIVTLTGVLFFPVLAPINYTQGLPGQFPRQVLLAKPLLAHTTGPGYIESTVEKQEEGDPAPLPIARRVVLLVEPTLQQVAETTSDPLTGAYRFNGLSMAARFTVVAYDHAHNWRAVIADNLAPSL